MAAREVGRVAGLWRYPVKSMAAEAMEGADVGWHGLDGDRRWAFIRAGMAGSGFPWLTIRENPRMWHYQPRLAGSSQPNACDTLVRTPSGAEMDVTDPALARELEPGARVMRQNRGIFDTFPLSLITTQTVEALGGMAGAPLDPLRFRPNLLVEAASGEPFAEDEWVGVVLAIGGMRMRVDKRDERCVMINVDPATTERNAAVLRAVARQRQACLGVYGTTVQPGRVSVGDAVVIEG
ncbi:MAG TPA: MOSC N-terminal beta barrel domain-containing protein [Longimicrobium sp.]|nr:MOSC N-terminal beta barrel domain-containing protein [Longimicrobium sp.]